MSIKPADKMSVEYAFTLTLTRRMRDLSTDDQFQVSVKEIQRIFRLHSVKFTLVLELTKNNDVHWHGICTVDLSKMMYKAVRCLQIHLSNMFRKNKIIGFVCFKQIDNFTKWLEYISKDIPDTLKRLGYNPVQTDDFELFEENPFIQ